MAVDIINIATHDGVEDFQALSSAIAKAVTEDSQFLERRNDIGKTASDVACMLGRKQILQELVTNGTNIRNITSNGYSSLHHAASWGRLDCVKLLVEAGADLQQKTLYGERARECASRYNQPECVMYLDKAEARTNLKALVQLFKDTISDPEKHMGKLSKEDRVTGNRACDEKTNWMETNKDTANLEEIRQAKDDLSAILEHIFAKLKDHVT